jgi:hypothetical protein
MTAQRKLLELIGIVEDLGVDLSQIIKPLIHLTLVWSQVAIYESKWAVIYREPETNCPFVSTVTSETRLDFRYSYVVHSMLNFIFDVQKNVATHHWMPFDADISSTFLQVLGYQSVPHLIPLLVLTSHYVLSIQFNNLLESYYNNIGKLRFVLREYDVIKIKLWVRLISCTVPTKDKQVHLVEVKILLMPLKNP